MSGDYDSGGFRDFVLLHLIIERRPVDTEYIGGFLDIPVVRFQNAYYVPFFDFFERGARSGYCRHR